MILELLTSCLMNEVAKSVKNTLTSSYDSFDYDDYGEDFDYDYCDDYDDCFVDSY